MKGQIKEKINKLYSSTSGRWLIAFLVGIVCVGMLMATRPVFFYLHDTNMMKTYSGYRTGIPTAEHTYGNMFVGYIMYWLYSLNMSVPWYTIFTFALLLFSYVSICKCLLTVAYEKNISIVFGISAYVALFVIAFYYQTAVILYTVNASIVGCASIAFLFAAFIQKNKKLCIAEGIISGVLLLISSFIRYSSFRSCLSFWLLALLLGIISKWRQTKSFKRSAVLLMLSIVCIGGIKTGNIINKQLREEANPEGFYELNQYRAKFMDYNTVSYSDAPELYDELGWSENFYNLVKDDYFMDEKYNAKSLRKIYEYSDATGTTKNTAKATLKLGYDTGILNKMGLALTCAMVASWIILMVEWLKSQKTFDQTLYLIGGTAAFAGCLLMCAYLCWGGRFPLRAYQVAAFPTLVTMLLCVLYLKTAPERTEEKQCFGSNFNKSKTWLLRGTTVVSALLVAVSVMNSLQVTYNQKEITKYQNDNQRYGKMVEYAQNHKENIYIHDITISGDERIYINSAKENALNLILWGGTNLYTSSYYRQLELLGKDRLFTENLFDDNVYYMTGNSDDYMDELRSYLEEQFPNVLFEQVDELSEGVRVYKILKSE